MKKLLNKSLRAFIIYALLVLLASIPVYYFLIDGIWRNELDEHNQIVASRTEAEFNRLQANDSALTQYIALWNKIQPTTTVREWTTAAKDSCYTILRENVYAKNHSIDRFRILQQNITINGKNFLLTVETNIEETEETVIALAIVTLFFFLILVIGFLVLNKRLSNKLWQPFRNTLHQLKTFNLNSQTAIAFEKSNTLEFEELNEALTKLIENNIDAYKTQKEFTENASHELQTPLAIIKNKLDLLLQKDALTERQYQLTEDINKSLNRISRINKNLLLLTKIDNHQFNEKEMVNLSTVLQQALTSFEAHFTDKNLQLHTQISPDVSVNGNRTLIEILVNNLLLNAIKYTADGGTVHITLQDTRLSIANTGTQSLHQEKLFQRFAKISHESAGTGLGLAIVQQICWVHQWTINYRFADNLHHFSIDW